MSLSNGVLFLNLKMSSLRDQYEQLQRRGVVNSPTTTAASSRLPSPNPDSAPPPYSDHYQQHHMGPRSKSHSKLNNSTVATGSTNTGMLSPQYHSQHSHRLRSPSPSPMSSSQNFNNLRIPSPSATRPTSPSSPHAHYQQNSARSRSPIDKHMGYGDAAFRPEMTVQEKALGYTFSHNTSVPVSRDSANSQNRGRGRGRGTGRGRGRGRGRGTGQLPSSPVMERSKTNPESATHLTIRTTTNLNPKIHNSSQNQINRTQNVVMSKELAPSYSHYDIKSMFLFFVNNNLINYF